MRNYPFFYVPVGMELLRQFSDKVVLTKAHPRMKVILIFLFQKPCGG
jgi:hypothetical protein